MKPFLNALVGFVVGVAGGLIGLGGAELRLPYLVGVLRLTPHQAVPVNLAVSLFTIVAAIPARLAILRTVNLEAFVTETVAIALGAIIAAYLGVVWLRRLSAQALGRIIFVLLVILASRLSLRGRVWLRKALVNFPSPKEVIHTRALLRFMRSRHRHALHHKRADVQIGPYAATDLGHPIVIARISAPLRGRDRDQRCAVEPCRVIDRISEGSRALTDRLKLVLVPRRARLLFQVRDQTVCGAERIALT
jgi:hypothetical protein